MKIEDRVVFFVACPMCDDVVLMGRELGVKFYLSILTVPVKPAKVLADWGVPVWNVRQFGRKLIAERLTIPQEPQKGWLVLDHDCLRDQLNWRTHRPQYGNITKKKSMVPPPVFED